MAPIRVKWDPEILAAGFRPSSIFDGLEADNTTASTSAASVTIDHVDVANPAFNITAGLNTIVRDAVERVVALAVNTTTTTTTAPVINTLVKESMERVVDLVANTTMPPTTTFQSFTPVAPSWSSTTPTTIPKRTVERTDMIPEIAVGHVSMIYTC